MHLGSGARKNHALSLSPAIRCANYWILILWTVFRAIILVATRDKSDMIRDLLAVLVVCRWGSAWLVLEAL